MLTARGGVRLAIITLVVSVSCTTGKYIQPAAPSNVTVIPNPTTPTTPPASPTAPAASVTRITITGNAALTKIGETSQLTATATLSDNTTKDITADGRWTVGDARVIAVGVTGLITVVGFGSTSVSCGYQSRGSALTVIATPPGTFVIAGRLRDPGRGPVPNVSVLDAMSGRSGTSDTNGQFYVAELPRLQARLKVDKDGYEPTQKDVTQSNVDLPVQRVVRLTAGETVKPDPLAPNDLSYDVGGSRCDDCHLIRVTVPQAGTVHVHVTWTGGAKLSLFAEGQIVPGDPLTLTADVPVSAAREVLMYLGAAPPNSVPSHTPFTFETSMR